jgi:serine/threonine-protein kinase
VAIDSRVLDLLERYEELRAKGEHVTPEALCADCPELVAEVCARIQALQALNPLLSTPTVSQDYFCTPNTPVNAPVNAGNPQLRWDAPGQRYRPLRFHKGGGIGEVFVAQDAELAREVALKRLQPRHQHESAARREFLREAEITARLEHPGVVPVHGLVQDETGQPCYAMRFIQGESLDAAIQRFHEADKEPKRDPGERSLALRELLNRFIAVCNTIAYAHSRGVLHRDLKPQNVMLGKYGETLVVDWGLAKPFERSEEARATGEETVRPSAIREGEHETAPGAVKGTPPYMSPEQASGRIGEIGPASDIFALGATLYAILTGFPPFRGSDALNRARRAEFVLPRQAKSGVPTALEAICLRAMASKPEDRYGTAKALADDVEKWLADEPVLALQEAWTARARRWGRRHRPLMAGAVALVLTAAVASTISAVLLGIEEAKTDSQKQIAERQREIADANRETADANFLEAIETMVDMTRVSEEFVIENDRQVIRQKLLTVAVDRFQKLLERHRDDPAARIELPKAQFRLAQIFDNLGKDADAVAAFEKARVMQEIFAASRPDDPQIQNDLANSWHFLGILHRKKRRWSAAEKALHEGLVIWQKLVDKYPDVPEYGRNLAQSLTSHGILLALRDDLRDANERDRAQKLALDYFRQGLERRRSLAAGQPIESEIQRDFAQSLNNMGVFLEQKNQLTEALEYSEQAIDIRRRRAQALPRVLEAQSEYGSSCHNLATLHRKAHRFDEALAAYQEARTVRTKLAKDNLGVPEYRLRLAQTVNDLGYLYKELGRFSDSRLSFSEVVSLWEGLFATDSGNRSDVNQLTMSLVNLGVAWGELGRIEDALATFEKAVTILQRYPRDQGFQRRLADTFSHIGQTLHAAGRLDEAVCYYDEALALWQGFFEKSRIRDVQRNLAHTHYYLARLQRDVGREEEAKSSLAEARKLQEALLGKAERKGEDDVRNDLALTLSEIGQDLTCEGNRTKALETVRLACDHQRAAFEQAPYKFKYWKGLSQVYEQLIRLYQQMDRPLDADKASKELTELAKKRKTHPR